MCTWGRKSPGKQLRIGIRFFSLFVSLINRNETNSIIVRNLMWNVFAIEVENLDGMSESRLSKNDGTSIFIFFSSTEIGLVTKDGPFNENTRGF